MLHQRLVQAQQAEQAAQVALNACYAAQAAAALAGGYVSCSIQEGSLSMAQAKVAECQVKYARACTIVAEAQAEASKYHAAPERRLQSLATEHTQATTKKLSGITADMEDYLNDGGMCLADNTALLGSKNKAGTSVVNLLGAGAAGGVVGGAAVSGLGRVSRKRSDTAQRPAVARGTTKNSRGTQTSNTASAKTNPRTKPSTTPKTEPKTSPRASSITNAAAGAMGVAGVVSGVGNLLTMAKNSPKTNVARSGVAPSIAPVISSGGIVSNLKKGNEGTQVTNLQNILKQKGLDVDVNGKFDDKTKKAVEEFQKSNCLESDGKVGFNTRNELQLDYTKAAKNLGIDESRIRALVNTESINGGFLDDGRVEIRFEGAKFREELLKPHAVSPNEMKKLQRSLFEGGYFGNSEEKDAVDGIYGKSTRNAIDNFLNDQNNKSSAIGKKIENAYTKVKPLKEADDAYFEKFKGQNIYYDSWKDHPNTKGAKEYEFLEKAIKENEEAAKSATSYGAFQIMGNEYKRFGFNSSVEFAEYMSKGQPQNQLDDFVTFVKSKGLDKHLQNNDLKKFVEGYNGKDNVEVYSKKLSNNLEIEEKRLGLCNQNLI